VRAKGIIARFVRGGGPAEARPEHRVDIDDTIKDPDVNNTKHMLENTFLLPFHSGQGWPNSMRPENGESARHSYLSLGPVQLCGPRRIFSGWIPKGHDGSAHVKWGIQTEGVSGMMMARRV
jgi:hypothetical protein